MLFQSPVWLTGFLRHNTAHSKAIRQARLSQHRALLASPRGLRLLLSPVPSPAAGSWGTWPAVGDRHGPGTTKVSTTIAWAAARNPEGASGPRIVTCENNLSVWRAGLAGCSRGGVFSTPLLRHILQDLCLLLQLHASSSSGQPIAEDQPRSAVYRAWMWERPHHGPWAAARAELLSSF